MNDEVEVQYYARRVPIFPRSVRGRFRRLKNAVLALAYGVYFSLPWVRWDRASGPDQAVLLDLPGRLFYLFDLVVHPQDIFWLTGFLVIAAWLLFFVTGMAGRVFCGYFCFQTLWTDVFVYIERLVQGERPARIRLSKQPWSSEKLGKLALTHLLWLAVAFFTGFTFVMYWGNAPDLALAVFRGEAPFPAYATIAFLTATTYVMAGLAREQVCTYMCPYARFQSVMFDRDTLIVSYDTERGEGPQGRAKVRRGLKAREERQAQGVGDCIDCGYCVQVCPTGIDIRNGLQLQCIHCALCIDACDSIMDNLGWPRGLVRYTSDNELAGGRIRVIKPKTIGYGLALSAAIGILIWGMLGQAKIDAAVSQVRQPLYVVLSDGRIQNSYEIKVNNKTPETVTVDVAIAGLQGAQLDLGRIERLVLEPEKSGRLLAKVRWADNPGSDRKQHDLVFQITPEGRDDIAPIRIDTHFFTP